MRFLYLFNSVMGTGVELRQRGWNHILKNHPTQFSTPGQFEPEAREALLRPERVWDAPVSEESTSTSTASLGFAGCSLNEEHTSRYLLIFVQECADADPSFIKSARRTNQLPWHARTGTQRKDPSTLQECPKRQAEIKSEVNAANRRRPRDAS